MNVDEDVAELGLLRRRASGPDADIFADPAAVARLEELETRVRLRFAARSGPVEPDSPEPEPEPEPERVVEGTVTVTTAPSAEVSTTVSLSPAERPPRYGWRGALVAGVAAVALLLGVQAAQGPTATPPEAPPLSASDAGPAVIRASDSTETRHVDNPFDTSHAR